MKAMWIGGLALLAAPAQAALTTAESVMTRTVDAEFERSVALLAKLARDQGIDGLSMGMTADFETAVMLGATHVRIGSALFGDRG